MEKFGSDTANAKHLTLACEGLDGGELARQKGNSEDRRKQIYGLYMEQMFKRKGMASLVFSKEKTIGWSSSLAVPHHSSAWPTSTASRSETIFLRVINS
jgi:hypothetical protein